MSGCAGRSWALMPTTWRIDNEHSIQGTGGAYSRWSRPCGNNGLSGGHGIQALTPTEALAWCEDAGIDADVIAQYFAVEEA